MRRIILIGIFLAGFVSSFAQEQVNAATKSPTGLSFTLRTDKNQYALGEPVVVTLTWQNITDKDFSVSTHTMMDEVEVRDEATKQYLLYKGMIACGTGGYKNIAAREKFEMQNLINNFRSPSFDLSKPGRYKVKSEYSSGSIDNRKNVWSGKLNSTATFEIVRLGESALNKEREKAVNGDKLAIQILAAHGDEAVIGVLAELVKSSDSELRETVYRALLLINTENSMRLLAERTNAVLPQGEKLSILSSLYYMEPLPNPVVISYMEKLLKDDYASDGSINREGESPKRIKFYPVRKWAYEILKKLNVSVQVVYEEEVKEDQTNDKIQ